MLLGFAGVSGAGKDLCASFLTKKHNFVRVGFADALKRAVGEVFGFSEEQLYGSAREVPDQRYTTKEGDLLTPRRALQWLGTEGFRTCCSDIWIIKALRDAELLMRGQYTYSRMHGVSTTTTVHPGWNGVVFADVRFMNEHVGIRAAGGVVIRLKRDTGIASAHQSEAELLGIPDSYYDYVIDNNKLSREELEAEVARIYLDLKAKQ